MERYYVGTDLKFLIELKADSFSMDGDGYEIFLRCGCREVFVPKEDIVVSGENHFMTVDSKKLGSGLVKLVVYAHVQDLDFSDHERTEVAVIDLCRLEGV